MVFVPRSKLQVEVLESREVLSSTLGGESLPPPPVTDAVATGEPSSALTIIDPTLSPVSPATSTLSATITALGPLVNGTYQTVTLQGLSASSVKSGSSLQLTVGTTTYTVDSSTATPDGQVQLLVSGGINPASVSVGTTAIVTTGAMLPCPVPAQTLTTPALILIIDPTLAPQQ